MRLRWSLQALLTRSGFDIASVPIPSWLLGGFRAGLANSAFMWHPGLLELHGLSTEQCQGSQLENSRADWQGQDHLGHNPSETVPQANGMNETAL